jgi:hypothetical protein
MGSAKRLMNYCPPLFASVRDCSQVFALFGLFATVLSIYNEQSDSSPLRIPLGNPTSSAGGDWASKTPSCITALAWAFQT